MQKSSSKLGVQTRLVGEKVLKTKKEIEELKAELQKLINDGLKKPTETSIAEASPSGNRVPHTTTLSPTIKNNQEEPPKRIRTYDKEAARAYIKKQKAKRIELLKNKKYDCTQDLKKQRLQELRQKSLELVSKSIKKRHEPEVLQHDVPEPPIHKNITIRIRDSEAQPIDEPQPKHNFNDLAKVTQAVVKVQAAFRGYRQRKLYRLMLQKRTVSKQVQTNHTLLLTPLAPYPYNFVNAVKRKLNLATAELVDVSVQAENASKIKSFLSHKCVNSIDLDPNDSDTSKNIPDISSDCASSKRPYSLRDLNVKKLRRLETVHSVEHLKSLETPDVNLVTNARKTEHLLNGITEEREVPILLQQSAVTLIPGNSEYSTKFDSNKGTYGDVTSQKSDAVKCADVVSLTTSVRTRTFSGNSGSAFSIDTCRSQSSADSDDDVASKSSHISSVSSTRSDLYVHQPSERVVSNEIHLQFEAELNLLNEFNESLQQVMAIEKSIIELRNSPTSKRTFQTRDTQTSILTRTSSELPSINYSRGCDFEETNNLITDLELSKDEILDSTKENNESITPYLTNVNTQTTLSLKMFEHLIKDEDARVENLKTILKLREKSLVDRTKGELAWLEVQKRQLRDSGQIQEISAIKKKQRGLLIKLQHERHEIQRLKQMQKAASRERKTVLKEQRNNMIKGQLSITNPSTKVKRKTKEYKQASGPLKVYNIKSCSESIISEQSFSRQSSVYEEVNSIASSLSIVTRASEEAVVHSSLVKEDLTVLVCEPTLPVETECFKKSLLLREAALQKRRKTAEELLQWHQRLIEEEKKITQLELAAFAILKQAPISNMDKRKTRSITGHNEKQFCDDTTLRNSLEQLCNNINDCNVSEEYTLEFEGVSEKHVEDTTIEEDLLEGGDESCSDTKNNGVEILDDPFSKSSIDSITEVSKRTVESPEEINVNLSKGELTESEANELLEHETKLIESPQPTSSIVSDCDCNTIEDAQTESDDPELNQNKSEILEQSASNCKTNCDASDKYEEVRGCDSLKTETNCGSSEMTSSDETSCTQKTSQDTLVNGILDVSEHILVSPITTIITNQDEDCQVEDTENADATLNEITDKSIKTLSSEQIEINNNDEITEETHTSDWTDIETNEIEDNLNSDVCEEKVDVKKRVNEILADSNILSPRINKGSCVQDIYTTTYDVDDEEITKDEEGSPKQIDDEVQQLLKKQIEIENEIKKIQQQQQKEQLPYLYVREIPNKPPPPYTPPVTAQTPNGSVLPTNELHLASITNTIASILYTAYTSKNLQNFSLPPEYKHQTSFEFIFDLCKEAAMDHYNEFEQKSESPWMHLTRRTKLALGKPYNQHDLNTFLLTKLRLLFGYDTIKSVENFKHKWSSKKRDHVDELLVVECQEEEADWLNYDKDELVVKEELCKDLMNVLLNETAQVFSTILNKKTFLR